MNDRERFLAVAAFEQPDYVPIFAFPGAPGMSHGCMKYTHDNLVRTGMPAHVGGVYEQGQLRDPESWFRYWGTTGPIGVGFGLARGARGIRSWSRIEAGFEVIEDECGGITRQVVNNDITYSMPDFTRFRVRDRASWEFWRERMTPTATMPRDEVEQRCRRLDDRTRPLMVGAGGVYGFLRGLMGPEAISYAFYDDQELVRDMCRWQLHQFESYTAPLIECLKPDIVAMGEDLCYNHGMLLSPAHFEEFCGPYYRAVCGCARAARVPVVSLDTDGNLMAFADIATRYGVNALYPCEVKAGNNLFALRRKHPRLILMGWLEKETINEGNHDLIEPEIRGKVPPLLAHGGYFPNGDHGIQPPATFANLCRFMTLLHEACGNPEGEFPRA